MTDSVTCFVADDHPAMVHAVCALLEQRGIEVVGTASNGAATIDSLAELQPTVALVDLRMPGVSGTEVTRQAARLSPSTAVILYTAYGEGSHLTEAIDAGARGFILKEAPLNDIVRAIEIVAAGGVYIDPVLAGFLATGAADKLPNLTQREREVLRLLADGLSNEEAGNRLSISTETVRTHVRKAMNKLDAETRTAAVATALRHSLIA